MSLQYSGIIQYILLLERYLKRTRTTARTLFSKNYVRTLVRESRSIHIYVYICQWFIITDRRAPSRRTNLHASLSLKSPVNIASRCHVYYCKWNDRDSRNNLLYIQKWSPESGCHSHRVFVFKYHDILYTWLIHFDKT